MKFQKLTIHNIASIEDAVIDFEAEPLASSEVFLITGKTGAGKSTILDSICLALFDTTPRLSGTKMEGETKDAGADVKVKDVRQLMRRNTAEAFVQLTFIGSNGVGYEATWTVARARRKVDGKIQIRHWQLRNFDTGNILTKVKEIEAEINTAIGLDFSQFCRTTMLAQGEFTRFLNSNDNDKAAILEKITGVDIYSKVGAKVYEVAVKKKQDWTDAQRAVEGIQTLTDEEIADRKGLQKELDQQQKEAKEQKNRLDGKLQWIKAEAELSSRMEKAAAELYKARAIAEGEESKRKENIIADWNDTIDARRWLADAEVAEKEVAEQQKALDKLKNSFAAVAGGMEYARKEISEVGTEICSLEKYLENEKSKAAVYEQAQTIIGQLAVIDEGRKLISKRMAEIENDSKCLNDELAPVYDRACKDATEAGDELRRKETEVSELEDGLGRLNLAALRRQRDEAVALLQAIAMAEERIETLADTKKKREQAKKELADRLNAINEKKKTLEAMLTPIHDAKLTMDVRKEGLDKQKSTVDGFAKAMRIGLHVGDVCPVCRQKVLAEMPHEDDLQVLVDGLQQDYDKAVKEYNEKVDAKNQIDSDIRVATDAYERDMKAFCGDSSVEKATEKVVDACRKCGISMFGEDAAAQLESKRAATKNLQAQLDSRISEGDEIEKSVRAQHKALDELRKRKETLDGKVKTAEKAKTTCQGKIDKAEAVVKAKKDDVCKATEFVAGIVSDDVWGSDWREHPKTFGEALKEAADIYNNKVARKQRFSALLSTLETQCGNVDSVIADIVGRVPSWRDLCPVAAAKVDNLFETANGLSGNIATAQAKMKRAEDSRRDNMERLTDFLDSHGRFSIDRLKTLGSCSSADISRYVDEAKKMHEKIAVCQSLLSNAKEQYDKHQEVKPELAEEDVPERLLTAIAGCDALLSAIAERKGGISQELKTDADNKARQGELIKVAEEKHQGYQKWERLNRMIGDATGSKFRKIAQSYVLTSLVYSANSYMKTLTDRYTLKVVPGTFVISLEDAYQGYVSRAATTISGGESFLVSLSLALALSDIGQQWQVDTLFIDEGFGTLSGEPLQKAVDTLRSLHSRSGRHVGIISHVEELKERIPVQIQVNQEGNNSSSNVVVVA